MIPVLAVETMIVDFIDAPLVGVALIFTGIAFGLTIWKWIRRLA